MTDKISGNGRVGLDMGAAKARAVSRVERGTETKGAARARESADVVELTDTAAKLKSIEARLAETSDVDRSRVDAIRKRIESGEYQPDAQRIARKLIRMERDLG